MPAPRIVVLEGDETGQELLDQALRVVDPDVLGMSLELERFDLSLENRRATRNAVCEEAAARMTETEEASRSIYRAVTGAAASGVRTTDLGGQASTTEFTDEVIDRVRGESGRSG